MPPELEAQKKYATIEEYLQIEEYSTVKHEYLGGTIVEMPGAKYSHNLINANIIRILGNILEVKYPDCKVLTSDMKIHISTSNSIVYPDACVLCGQPIFYKNRKDLLSNPAIIIEILSESTQAYDRGEKFEKYTSLDSLEEYILISQDEPLIEVFSLIKREEYLWKIRRYRDLEEEVKLYALDIGFKTMEVFKNIDFQKD